MCASASEAGKTLTGKVIDRMKKIWYLVLALVLAVFCTAYIAVKGDTYVLELNVSFVGGSVEDYSASFDKGDEILRIEDVSLQDGKLRITVRSVSKGRDYIEVSGPLGPFYMDTFYVHSFGIITKNVFLGDMTGGNVILAAITLYLSVILFYIIRVYAKDMKRSLYQYRNIRNLGWIMYLIPMLLMQILYMYSSEGIHGSIRIMMNAASISSFFALPVAFIMSIFVTISNIQLMKNEGRNWRNMLGCMFGIFLFCASLFPYALGEILQRSTWIDVHNERGIAHHIEMLVENTILVVVTYIECILLGTIVLSVKAARSIPAFDKDYVIILGCQIKEDGTLTNLLRGRVDRAVEFARMQKDRTGKDIVFVPSGGKGPDEVISEAEAMRNYLTDIGIPGESILAEDKSANTYENMRNSAKLIRDDFSGDEPKIAFSTTNYHVFRSGILARRQGLNAEGIGSGTKSYFWINAFIREFIATLYSERKSHLIVTALLVLSVFSMVLLIYFSNVL